MKLLAPFFKRNNWIVVSLILVLSSCRAHYIAEYNAEISKQVENTSKMVDEFYLKMMETTTPVARPYAMFANQYVDIEIELNSLLLKNKVRPLNQNSVRICEITLQMWEKYKNEHKQDNKLSDGLIKLNRKYMSDLFFAMQVAEEGKKLASSVPQSP